MNYNLIQIIKEEINDFYSDWQTTNEPNIVDKYYDKKYGFKTNEPKTNIKAELLGYVDKQGESRLEIPIPVYKNPKNLDYFTTDARGILLNNGDLYLAQSYNALHDNILNLLLQHGIIPFASKFNYDTKYPEYFVAVVRANLTNVFGQSTIYDEFPLYYRKIFEIANRKQPFEFKVSKI